MRKMNVLHKIDEDYSESEDNEVQIIQKIVKDFNEVKLDCKSQDLIILVEGNTPKFIDFVGAEEFE